MDPKTTPVKARKTRQKASKPPQGARVSYSDSTAILLGEPRLSKARKAEITAMRAACLPEHRDRLEALLQVDARTASLCQFCGRPAGIDKTCDGCWEVTSRLDLFLRAGGTAAANALREALRKQKGATFDDVEVGDVWEWSGNEKTFEVLSKTTGHPHTVKRCDGTFAEAWMSRDEFERGEWTRVK